jgi:hypothetical protein
MDSDDITKIIFKNKENNNGKHLQILQKYCSEQYYEEPVSNKGPLIKIFIVSCLFVSLTFFASIYQFQNLVNITSFPIINTTLYCASLFALYFIILFLFFAAF